MDTEDGRNRFHGRAVPLFEHGVVELLLGGVLPSIFILVGVGLSAWNGGCVSLRSEADSLPRDGQLRVLRGFLDGGDWMLVRCFLVGCRDGCLSVHGAR